MSAILASMAGLGGFAHSAVAAPMDSCVASAEFAGPAPMVDDVTIACAAQVANIASCLQTASIVLVVHMDELNGSVAPAILALMANVSKAAKSAHPVPMGISRAAARFARLVSMDECLAGVPSAAAASMDALSAFAIFARHCLPCQMDQISQQKSAHM